MARPALDMAKKKRSRADKKSGAIHSKRTDAPASASVAAAWDDLEQSFFASAPPDTAAPPAQPERFDDLDEGWAVPIRRRRSRAELRDALGTIRRLADALVTAPWLNRRNITIALASFMLLVGLSAVVFASR
jgi:hypothetical protein